MNERVQAIILANKDTSVQSVVDSVAGFEHGAVAGKRTVDANKLQLGAEVARGLSIEARHLASVLLAFEKSNDILPRWDLSITVLKGGADADTIYAEVAVSVLTFGIITS